MKTNLKTRLPRPSRFYSRGLKALKIQATPTTPTTPTIFARARARFLLLIYFFVLSKIFPVRENHSRGGRVVGVYL